MFDPAFDDRVNTLMSEITSHHISHHCLSSDRDWVSASVVCIYTAFIISGNRACSFRAGTITDKYFVAGSTIDGNRCARQHTHTHTHATAYNWMIWLIERSSDWCIDWLNESQKMLIRVPCVLLDRYNPTHIRLLADPSNSECKVWPPNTTIESPARHTHTKVSINANQNNRMQCVQCITMRMIKMLNNDSIYGLITWNQFESWVSKLDWHVCSIQTTPIDNTPLNTIRFEEGAFCS